MAKSDDKEEVADDAEHDLVFIGIIGIKDPVRPEVRSTPKARYHPPSPSAKAPAGW